ncbi:MAG: thioesterase family protein [Spirochaetota bacterium]
MDKNPDNYRNKQLIHVTWSDLDLFGHVNNVIYSRYFEEVRADYFSNLQLWKLGGKGNSNGLVIVNLNMDFRKQATYPEVLTAYLRIAHLGGKSARMEFLLQNAAQEAVLTATGTFVWFDFDKQASDRIPDLFREKVIAFEKKL